MTYFVNCPMMVIYSVTCVNTGNQASRSMVVICWLPMTEIIPTVSNLSKETSESAELFVRTTLAAVFSLGTDTVCNFELRLKKKPPSPVVVSSGSNRVSVSDWLSSKLSPIVERFGNSTLDEPNPRRVIFDDVFCRTGIEKSSSSPNEPKRMLSISD